MLVHVQDAGVQPDHWPPGVGAGDSAFSSRVFFASASHEVPDGQGRISIPYPLRSYAGLIRGNECVIIGANTRIEIWAPDVWQEYLESTEQGFAVAESIVPGV
jgi:MraZ protein